MHFSHDSASPRGQPEALKQFTYVRLNVCKRTNVIENFGTFFQTKNPIPNLMEKYCSRKINRKITRGMRYKKCI